MYQAAYWIDSLPAAYLVVKLINAVLMSITAVPVYFLARRVVSPGWAVVAAAGVFLFVGLGLTCFYCGALGVEEPARVLQPTVLVAPYNDLAALTVDPLSGVISPGSHSMQGQAM